MHTQTIALIQALEDSRTIDARLRHDLADMAETWPHTGLAYQGPADFVLRHGQLKRADTPAPFQGAPRQCYWNALLGSLSRGWAYVEGFAAHPMVQGVDGRAAPVAHAWNEDAGRVIDLTWPLGAYVSLGAYMGVAFSAARAHDCAWHGDACVLHDEHRGWGVLTNPWTGEDSPGDLSGLLDVVVADMRAHGGDFARTAKQLERRARAQRWPAAAAPRENIRPGSEGN